jgi:hypothetical protein
MLHAGSTDGNAKRGSLIVCGSVVTAGAKFGILTKLMRARERPVRFMVASLDRFWKTANYSVNA